MLGWHFDEFIANIPANPAQAVTEWLVLCVERPLKALERELWSAIWLVELQTNQRQQLTQRLKDFHVSKSIQFLVAMQQRVQFSPELDIDIASKLFDTIAIHFYRKIVIERRRDEAQLQAGTRALRAANPDWPPPRIQRCPSLKLFRAISQLLRVTTR